MEKVVLSPPGGRHRPEGAERAPLRDAQGHHGRQEERRSPSSRSRSWASVRTSSSPRSRSTGLDVPAGEAGRARSSRATRPRRPASWCGSSGTKPRSYKRRGTMIAAFMEIAGREDQEKLARSPVRGQAAGRRARRRDGRGPRRRGRRRPGPGRLRPWRGQGLSH